LEKGDFFTKEKLKEELNKLKQLITGEPPHNIVKLQDYNGTIIDVETLYEKYFDKDVLIAKGFSGDYLSEPEKRLKTEKEREITPILQKGVKKGSPTICPYCNKLLPEDLKNTTIVEGKTWHILCSIKYREGRKETAQKTEASEILLPFETRSKKPLENNEVSIEEMEYPDSLNDLKRVRESVKAARLFSTTELEKKEKEE